MPKQTLKLISWNVNGLNALMAKGFVELVRDMDADIIAIQETKLQEAKLTEAMKNIDGYESYWAFSTVKKGYSGVGTYTRIPPITVRYGIGIPEYDQEGRICEMDFGNFILFNVYFPNGQMGENRLQYKLRFYEAFFSHIDRYRLQGKSVIVCGDFNTAHNEIDLKNPKANENYSGFLRDRTGLDGPNSSKRLCGHVPISLPGYRKIFLVDLPVRSQIQKYRMADRLFCRFPGSDENRPGYRCLHR